MPAHLVRHLLVAPHLHGRRRRVLDQLLQLLQLCLLPGDQLPQLVGRLLPLAVHLDASLLAPLLARPRRRRQARHDRRRAYRRRRRRSFRRGDGCRARHGWRLRLKRPPRDAIGARCTPCVVEACVCAALVAALSHLRELRSNSGVPQAHCSLGHRPQSRRSARRLLASGRSLLACARRGGCWGVYGGWGTHTRAQHAAGEPRGAVRCEANQGTCSLAVGGDVCPT